MQMTVGAVCVGAEGNAKCLVSQREVEAPSEAIALEIEGLGFKLPVSRYYPEQNLIGVLVTSDQFAALAGTPEWKRP